MPSDSVRLIYSHLLLRIKFIFYSKVEKSIELQPHMSCHRIAPYHHLHIIGVSKLLTELHLIRLCCFLFVCLYKECI